MTAAVYNEIDGYACAWLRNLIDAEQIAGGRVERRPIQELRATDVSGPGQRHFFAGIGVWSYALRLAEVPDDASVWTGSCPCQPFSSAGRRRGTADERHLWPEWFRLIRECRPAIVFGEQVAGPAGLDWYDVVAADLEGEGFAVGAADLAAASVGAPHMRQRLYFVAYDVSHRLEGRQQAGAAARAVDRPGVSAGVVAYSNGERLQGLGVQLQQRGPLAAVSQVGGGGPIGYLGHANGPDVQRRDRAQSGSEAASGHRADGNDAPPASPTRGAWHPCDWVQCRDGKARPVEPGAFPLAHGAPGYVGRLRAYGNAIVPQVAAAFVRAALEAASNV